MTGIDGARWQADQALAVPVEPVARLDPTGFDPSRKHHPLLAVGEIPCCSCPRDYPFPARYIASAKRINDLPPLDWPVCEMHSQHAMVAGWFPLRTPEEWRAAIAMEASGGDGDNTAPSEGRQRGSEGHRP